MDLLPAIDIRSGHCVRLLRGDFAVETVYDADPVGVAKRFEAAGAAGIHVVDLDAARTGDLENLEQVAAICSAVSCPVQVGGGVRSLAGGQQLVDAGATRVVVGTAAVEQPALVEELTARLLVPVAVGLDVSGREVRIRGWTEEGDVDLVELAHRFDDRGAAALVVTQIDRDGTMTGPDLEAVRAVLRASDLPIVASGGVGRLEDLQVLAALARDEPRLEAVIVGRAIYENRFSVEEAIEACSRPG